MDDPAPGTGLAATTDELARLRRRAGRLLSVFGVLVVVALGVGIVSTELSNPAGAVLLAVSGAAVTAMTVLTVVLLRIAARVRGIHQRARNPPG